MYSSITLLNCYCLHFFYYNLTILYKICLQVKEVVNSIEKKSEEVKDTKKKKGCDNDEAVAVLAHEIGHWKYNHVLK